MLMLESSKQRSGVALTMPDKSRVRGMPRSDDASNVSKHEHRYHETCPAMENCCACGGPFDSVPIRNLVNPDPNEDAMQQYSDPFDEGLSSLKSNHMYWIQRALHKRSLLWAAARYYKNLESGN